ncbi:DUF805 domain-containing protein, partial [Mesorhizobium sp.]|uniref:DUF805 domain-containing protein n=1 Tax=Mesorhizobium sp. TaxID=1871066 RepID=UPI0035672A4C
MIFAGNGRTLPPAWQWAAPVQHGGEDWTYLLTSFNGRINRAKFWAGIGVFIPIGIVALILDTILGTRFNTGGGAKVGIIGSLAGLASIYFAIALYAKRWHDRDKSGWWTLIGLVPVIGGIWLLVELGFLEGTRGA